MFYHVFFVDSEDYFSINLHCAKRQKN